MPKPRTRQPPRPPPEPADKRPTPRKFEYYHREIEKRLRALQARRGLQISRGEDPDFVAPAWRDDDA